MVSQRAASVARFAEGCRKAADSLAGALARRGYVYLTVASVFYFWATCYRAQRRLFWYDELFTFYVARLPGIRAIWAACMHGADLHPPLFYLVTRWSQTLFGADELGARIPEVVGFWVFCICLYRFVSARTGALAGFLALLLPLTTGGYWYAYEARPYGIVLGLFGVALVSWQTAGEREARRFWPLVALAASLSAAALCHGYAFLLFVSLGIGALARDIRRRRIDGAVWCALLVPAMVSVLTVLPLLTARQADPGRDEGTVVQSGLWSGWGLTAGSPFMLALLALCVLVLLMRTRRPRGARNGEGRAQAPARHEIAALVGTIAAPLVALLASPLTHAPLYGRYSLIAAAGIVSLMAMVLARSNLAGVLVLALTAANIAYGFGAFYRGRSDREPSSMWDVGTRIADADAEFAWIASAGRGGDPIVVTSALRFGPMFHYAPPSLLPRLAFLIPSGDTGRLGEMYLGLINYCRAPGAVIQRTVLLSAHRAFFLYGGRVHGEAGAVRMRELGARTAVVGCRSGSCMWRVEFPQTRAGDDAQPNPVKRTRAVGHG